MKAIFIILLFVIGFGVIALTNARPQRAMALETSTPEKTLSSDIHNYLNVTQEEINNFITLDEYDDRTIFGIRLTAAEILLFADYPDKALLAYGCSRIATLKVEELFINPHADGNNSNAFKHAYWNALMTITMGSQWAKIFADAHEYGHNDLNTTMDLANNERGRADGITYGSLSTDQLALQMASRVASGYYVRIIDGELYPTNWEELKPQYAFNTTNIGSNAIQINNANFTVQGSFPIPDIINNRTVTTIAPQAFRNQTGLTGVTFPSTVTTVGNRAFQFCYNLETVDMSAATSVTRIEAYTFDTCILGNLTFPPNLQYIGEGAFIRTGAQGDVIPNSVTYIGDYAFAYVSGSLGYGLPDNLITLGAYAFAYNGSMIILYNGSSLTTIGDGAFRGTSLLGFNFPASVNSIGAYAFAESPNTNFYLPANSLLTSIGNYAFLNDALTTFLIPTSITSIGAGAFNGNTSLTVYTGFASKPSGWNTGWNGSSRPVFWGCTLSSDKGYVISFTKSSSNPSSPGAENGISNPTRSGYTFGGWYTTSDFSGTQYTSANLTTTPNGALYTKWNPPSSCVAEGTLITLADGSQVAVENLTGDESLLVWNMFTGTFDAAPILFIDSDPYAEYEIVHLSFSDGTDVKVISEHGFWDIDLNEYVFLRSDAARYIGHRFNKQTDDGNGNMIWTEVQLVGVDIYTEYTTARSPVTFGRLCYYVNGMLSMPGATEGLINVFEVDAATMQYDTDAFNEDVETYGLFTYGEFAEILSVPEIIFEAFNGQYLKVSIGKGLIDIEGLAALIERYAGFFPAE